MKRLSPYIKMRVLGAIEFAPGNSVIARIHHVSAQTFNDEEGVPLKFTWRTIQTWYSRYKKDGVTAMKPKPRSDRGSLTTLEVPVREHIPFPPAIHFSRRAPDTRTSHSFFRLPEIRNRPQIAWRNAPRTGTLHHCSGGTNPERPCPHCRVPPIRCCLRPRGQTARLF